VEIIEKAGGLHNFIKRDMPIITDSGGFQVFSLAYGSVAQELKSCGCKRKDKMVLKITEKGVVFRSYRDGKKITLTPESSIQAQKALKADIIIPFDELPPYHVSQKSLRVSLERTHRWEKRSLEEHMKNPQNQAIYGVIHGGVDQELRKESCRFLSALPFNGFAIGGSVGKTKKEMIDMLKITMAFLPKEQPVHLLGIGDLPSLEMTLPLGIDTFDSSYPTRAARHAMAFTEKGAIKISKKEYAKDFSPIDSTCPCWTCMHYHRAYLHHLFKAKELSFYSLMTLHNLAFMVEFMKEIRKKISQDII
jgi:queuine tRNA-ribosyltransferase